LPDFPTTNQYSFSLMVPEPTPPTLVLISVH